MSLENVKVHDATLPDVDAIAELDRKHSGDKKPDYWQQLVSEFCQNNVDKIALLAKNEKGELLGFLFGEVRAWEFGSARCGWIFSVAVDPNATRTGMAGLILDVARNRFRDLGVSLMRTMVRRDDVPMASFFRSTGFVAGPYAELECSLAIKSGMNMGGCCD